MNHIVRIGKPLPNWEFISTNPSRSPLIVYQVRSSSEDSYPHVRPKVWSEADWIWTDPAGLSDNQLEPDDNWPDQIIIDQVQNKDVGWSGWVAVGVAQ